MQANGRVSTEICGIEFPIMTPSFGNESLLNESERAPGVRSSRVLVRYAQAFAFTVLLTESRIPLLQCQ